MTRHIFDEEQEAPFDSFDEFDEFEEFDDDDEVMPKPRRWIGRVIAILVVLAFLLVSFPNLYQLFLPNPEFVDESLLLSNDEIVEMSSPAVVRVEAYLSTPGSNNVRQGTGFNITPEGRIVTNAHIVEGATAIQVRFPSGKMYAASLYEFVDGIDVALLDVEGTDLPFLEVDQESPLQEGAEVTVIGNPLGYRHIAQKGEILTFHRVKGSTVPIFMIDITLHPGNSGSPVIDQKGEVIGVIFAVSASEEEGMRDNGLAIPLRELSDIYLFGD